MAKVIEQVIAIKLSKIVKDDDHQQTVLNTEQAETLITAIPTLAESALNDNSIVVEILELS